MKQFSSQLGGKLGVGLCAAGFLALFLGWNGAASVDRVPSQFPYLISGGIAGLSLVVCGIGLLMIQNQRADRAELQATIRELRQAMAEVGLATQHPDVENRQEFSLPVKRATPAEYALGDSAETHTVDDDDEIDDDDETPATSKRRRGPLKAKS